MPRTAAILIIGNEILSGRTQDTNTAWLGQQLDARGIRLNEVRVVRDEEEAIVAALNALRETHDYVFTTGGIGPTHDDITAACVAKAFGVALPVNEEARRILAEYYAMQAADLTDARLRMARIPEGAELIANPVSGAPGFKIGNVFVMAGVPAIMRGMFDGIAPNLEGGAPVLSRQVTCSLRESDVAPGLAEIQEKYPDIEIGSYPNVRGGQYGLTLVLRGQDEAALDTAAEEVGKLVQDVAQKTKRGA